MKPASFEYFRPRTTDEVVALLQAHGGEAKLLAGGQSLIPAMNFRLATPSVLIDLNAVDQLSYISDDSDGVRIGAMTRQRMVERSTSVARMAPLITETMPFVAHAAIRNRGTVGGSLAHADPAAELPAVMLALNATFSVRAPGGVRSVSADDFFVGLFATAVEPGELLEEVRVPKTAGRRGFAFQEISRRQGDFALVGVAASVCLDNEGRCSDARIALLSVGDRPVLAMQGAGVLFGQTPGADVIRAAADVAATGDIDPPSDIHASAKYRRQLARVLTRRVLERAFERAL